MVWGGKEKRMKYRNVEKKYFALNDTPEMVYHSTQTGQLGEAFAESVSDNKPHDVTASVQIEIKGW